MGTGKNRLAEAVLTSTHNLCFEQKYEKYQNYYLKTFVFFGGKIFSLFEIFHLKFSVFGSEIFYIFE